jgi:glycosyltransferase involved in cell wall biosynthesis
MHVLQVSPHLPPRFLGGVEVYTQHLMRNLAARGHRVQGVAVDAIATGPENGCAGTTERADGYDVHRLTLTIPPSAPFHLLSDHPPTEAWFEQHLRAARPDVMHVQSGYLLGAPALAAARRTGTPVVLTLHDYWFACPRVTRLHPSGAICSGPERPEKCAWCLTADQRRYRLLDALLLGRPSQAKDRSWAWRMLVGATATPIERRRAQLAELLASARVVLAPSRFVAVQVAAIGYPAERVRESRCGIPAMPRRRHRAAGTLRLSFIGQLAPHKGVHLLVAAVRALRDRPVTLAIHGPLTPYPDYVATLRTLAGDDPRITFHGRYHRDALPELFEASDAVVVPSVWHEVAALVIQEAQAAGVPVVASALGGSPELIADGVDGLLFDPAEPGALGRQLTRLLDEPDLLPRLEAAAPRPRTTDEEVEALLALYDDVRAS